MTATVHALFGTADADDLAARGLVVQTVDVPDGKQPTIVDGRLVAANPPAPPTPAPSIDERLTAIEAALTALGRRP